MCVCIPILVTTFPEWLSGAEPLPHTPGTVRPSASCLLCVLLAHAQFAGLIRRTPPPTFSDSAITDRHSDTTIFQLRAHWVRISWSIGSEKSFECAPSGSRTLDFLHARGAPYPLDQALRFSRVVNLFACLYILDTFSKEYVFNQPVAACSNFIVYTYSARYKSAEFANSTDTDEMAQTEPHLRDLHCFPSI